MSLNWFLSRTVRDATALYKHVFKILNHQRDILSPQAVGAVQASLDSLQGAVRSGASREQLQNDMGELEKVGGKWLKPYPHAAWRENVEVLLVALAVAMGIRTFFLQPFKIPTGSMQPTLYGVVSENLLGTQGEVPSGLARVRDWFRGISYVHVVARNSGQLEYVEKPFRLLIFNIYQRFRVGGNTYWLWFPPDYGADSLQQRAGLNKSLYNKGEDIIKLKIAAGDHLFVDRVTYNFRPPKRGEIIVFETKGIPEEQRDLIYNRIPGDQFYIKRLVGLGGEQIQLGEDRHLRINGKRLDASTPHFEKVYGFKPDAPPAPSQYSGHVGAPGTQLDYLARFFADKSDGVKIPEDDYMVMGDNTVSSLDSRSWGTFPSKYVIGKSFFVYWPMTGRFGLGYKD